MYPSGVDDIGALSAEASRLFERTLEAWDQRGAPA